MDRNLQTLPAIKLMSLYEALDVQMQRTRRRYHGLLASHGSDPDQRAIARIDRGLSVEPFSGEIILHSSSRRTEAAAAAARAAPAVEMEVRVAVAVAEETARAEEAEEEEARAEEAAEEEEARAELARSDQGGRS